MVSLLRRLGGSLQDGLAIRPALVAGLGRWVSGESDANVRYAEP